MFALRWHSRGVSVVLQERFGKQKGGLALEKVHLKSNSCAGALNKNNTVSRRECGMEAQAGFAGAAEAPETRRLLSPEERSAAAGDRRAGSGACSCGGERGAGRHPAPAAAVSCLLLQRRRTSRPGRRGDAPPAREAKARAALRRRRWVPEASREQWEFCAALGPQPPAGTLPAASLFSSLALGQDPAGQA